MTRVAVPGTTKHVLLRKEVAPLFLNLLARVNKEVLHLNPGPLDSWEYRGARTGAGLSNHASGTAIDFRYDVLLADHRAHMTKAQHRAMEHILDAYKTADGHRLFGWGGEWQVGKYCDEMHIEVGQDWQVGRAITPADFVATTKRLHVRADGTVAKPPPKPASKAVHLHLLRPGLTNAEVKHLQQVLASRHLFHGVADGHFGATTRAAVVTLQRSLGFTGHDADGVPGAKSLAALGLTALA